MLDILFEELVVTDATDQVDHSFCCC